MFKPDRRKGPVVKGTCCSYRGPEFGSQYPHDGGLDGGSWPSVPGDLTLPGANIQGEHSFVSFLKIVNNNRGLVSPGFSVSLEPTLQRNRGFGEAQVLAAPVFALSSV